MDEVDVIVTRLNDADMNVRWKAVVAARQMYDDRVIEALLDRLRDREPEVRAKAAQSLAYKYHERIAPELLPLLRDRDVEVRVAACQGLGGRYYREALQPLIDRLRDPEPEVRAAAADALGSYYSRRAVQALLPLLHDSNAKVRREAVKALSNLGDLTTAQPLLRVAQSDGNLKVRLAAIEGLRYLVPRYEEEVWDGDDPDDDLVGHLLELLNDEEDQVAIRAMETLAEVGAARAVVPLVTVLCNWDADFGRRLFALRALGDLGDFRVTPLLIATLSDWEPLMRPHAAYALGRLCDPRALTELDRLANDERDKLGEEARKAAQHIRYELSWQDFDRLVEYLESEDSHEQRRAVTCLADSMDPRAAGLVVKTLRRSLNNLTLLLFVDTTRVVARMGLAEALPVLVEAAEFWASQGVPGAVDNAEAAANYIRRKLNGESLAPYRAPDDEEENYELDD